jgi:hypothetical protein
MGKEEGRSKKTHSIRVSKREKQDNIYPLRRKNAMRTQKKSPPETPVYANNVCLSLYGCINGFYLLFV